MNERTTGPDPEEEDNCPECGRHSTNGRVCKHCMDEHEHED